MRLDAKCINHERVDVFEPFVGLVGDVVGVCDVCKIADSVSEDG